MKLSITLIVIGVLLVIIEFISKIMLWPDLFNGFLIGTIIFTIGLILLIRRNFNNKSKN